MTEGVKLGRGRLFRRILLKHLGRLLLLVLTVAVAAALMLYSMLRLACRDPRFESCKQLFATTILETGALKWTARLVMSEEEIEAVLSKNTLEEMDVTMDESMITVAAVSPAVEEGEQQEANASEEEFDIDGIEIVEIHGRTYDATLMIVNDPSRVFCGTTASRHWASSDLKGIVEDYDAIGGVNGGLYDQLRLTPYYFQVADGELVFNEGCFEGLYIVGFDTDNILRIIPTGNGGPGTVRKLVEENHIRDAVPFQEANGADTAHFVPLVINGEPRETSGLGSGANPRTAIGQRADGSVLLLVTDGRGTNGHLGANASDLIDIMVEYGAVNAANIDGGSSSAMYYDGQYLMTSTTLYYANSSYKLPAGFLVRKR